MHGDFLGRAKADAWIYLTVLAYSAIIAVLSIYMGRPIDAIGRVYLGPWQTVLALALAVYLAQAALVSVRSGTPWQSFRERLRHLVSPRIVFGTCLFMLLGSFLGTFTVAKTLLEVISPFTWDIALADLDEGLHGGDPWRLFPAHHGFTRFIQWLYTPGWLLLLCGVSLYFCFTRDDVARRRYIGAFLFCWIFLGNVMALQFHSAGPVFYSHSVQQSRFAPMLDYLEFSRDLPFSSVNISDHLWAMHARDEVSQGTGISAFPSLHLAMATLWFLALRKVHALMGWVLSANVLLIQIGSVHLGWHYAIDGYFSIIATLLFWKLAGAQWLRQPIT